MISADTTLLYIPLVISILTGLTLTWGVFIGCWLDYTIRSPAHVHHRTDDDIYELSIWCANIVIFILGFMVPIITPGFRSSIGDAVVVIDVFYASFLVLCTINLLRWNLAVKSPSCHIFCEE